MKSYDNYDSILHKQMRDIRGKGIREDNYSNKNYEMACSYAKAMELTIRDKENNIDNYYEVEMCPNKNPYLDAYIVCTTEIHNDYGLQIKSGNHYNMKEIKDKICKGEDRFTLVPENYTLITWGKQNSLKHPKIPDESILNMLSYLEDKKDIYPQEYAFIRECFNTILNNQQNMNDANWLELNRLQSNILDKNSLEDKMFQLPY